MINLQQLRGFFLNIQKTIIIQKKQLGQKNFYRAEETKQKIKTENIQKQITFVQKLNQIMHPSNNKYFFQHNQLQQQNELEQTKIQKILLIQGLQQNFSHQYNVKIPYDYLTRQLDLTQILHEIFFQTLNPIYQYQIFYFSNNNGFFHFGGIYPWEEENKFILGEEFILKEDIFIGFRKIVKIDGAGNQKKMSTNKASSSSFNEQSPYENKKKRRVNDRTIIQTLQKVSLWRSKCQSQKITYQQAAKQIDIPKKTLDDYFALIRAGQQYGFDFEKNFYQKIGVLRQFVKEKNKINKEKKKKQTGYESFQSNDGQTILSSKNKNLSVKEYNENQFDEKEFNSEKQERKLSIIDKMMLQDVSENEEQEEE